MHLNDANRMTSSVDPDLTAPPKIYEHYGTSSGLVEKFCNSSYEPRHEKMCLRESPTRQDTN